MIADSRNISRQHNRSQYRRTLHLVCSEAQTKRFRHYVRAPPHKRNSYATAISRSDCN